MNWLRQLRQTVATSIAHKGNVRHKGTFIESESGLGQIRNKRIEKSALAGLHLATARPDDPVVRPTAHPIEMQIEGFAMNIAGNLPQQR